MKLVDLSEGGALLEVDAPLRPGVLLTLELSGPGIETAVPLEVVRCYIATLRGETTIYRGACAFSHRIAIPGAPMRELDRFFRDYKTLIGDPKLAAWKNLDAAMFRLGWMLEASGNKLGAAEIYRKKLDEYEPPPLDDAVRQELEEYVVRRRAELGD